MFRHIRFGALLATLGFSWCTAFAGEPLLTPAELQPLVQSNAVTVIDTRPAAAYAKGHIPGSLSAPYGEWRGPASNPGKLLSLEQFTAIVRALGLTPQTKAVVLYAGVNSTDFGSAARVYWTLKSLGIKDPSILNGGLKAWQAAGLPLTDKPSAATPSAWQPQFSTRWLATRTDVEHLLGKPNVVLMDARPVAFYEGHVKAPAAHARGTLPGAVDLDNAVFFEKGSAALLGKPELAARAAKLHAAPDEETVSFCNTGHWAATNWFVLSEMLGRPNIRLYPESMVGWTSAATPLPMANTPSRVQQLRYELSAWVNHTFSTAK